MLQWANRDSALHVPSLWTWEILNTVGVVIKRRRISADRGREFMAQLAMLNFRIDPAPPISEFPRLHTLATLHGLTAYDASYLDLAIRLALPLATLDADLGRACRSEGIPTL